MFALVVTCKKELADDKAVLLSNAHHGLCLSKLKAGCIVSALHETGEIVVLCLFINTLVIRIILMLYMCIEIILMTNNHV